jgi:hypothetical protein
VTSTRKKKKPHLFTDDEKAFVHAHYKGIGNKELAEMFNRHFGSELTASQIDAFKARNKLNSGLTSRFPEGHVPYNKGHKGTFRGGPDAEKHQFKKGNKPHNWVPIGTERISKDGYIEVKAYEGRGQRNWRSKHAVIWEKHHGRKVPRNHVVLFGDGDNRNLDPDNLLLVSRAQLARLNQRGLIKNDAELTKVGITIADIYLTIAERKREPS